MKTNPIFVAVVLATACSAASAFAQAPSAPPAATASNSSDPARTLAPNQVVYSSHLPTAQELSNAAAAEGRTIDRIDQTSTQVVAVYKLPNGLINTVAYVLLPTANGSPSTATATLTTGVPANATAIGAYTSTDGAYTSPTVVYAPDPATVYYDPYLYSGAWPWYGYPGVALGFGLGVGYHYPYYRGYYHGGFYHGGGVYHRGGGVVHGGGGVGHGHR